MRTLRKVMLGVSVSALALVAAGGVNAKATEGDPTASPETPTPGSSGEGSISTFAVTGEQTLDVTWSGGDLFVSFDAYKKDALNPKATWNLYEEGTSVGADLSTLKTTKDAYIAVKVGTGNPAIYKIAGEKAAKIKATYKPNATTADKKLEFTGLPEGAGLEYRTAASGWMTYKEKGSSDVEDLERYEQQGATLYFRTVGEGYEVDGDVKTEDDYSLANLKGSFPSKEFKVKIPKRAKGPSVKIDYVKGAITKPSKGEVEIKGGSAATFTKMAGDEALDFTNPGVILIRTAATDKKPVSNPVVISYKLDAAPLQGDLKIEYTKGKTQGKGSVSISGKSGVTYAVYQAADEATAKETARKGGKEKPLATIKAGKPVKIAESKLTGGLYVAIAADAKTGKFQTEVVELATKAEVEAGLKVETATTAPSTAPSTAPESTPGSEG